jgi:hypothetical protein
VTWQHSLDFLIQPEWPPTSRWLWRLVTIPTGQTSLGVVSTVLLPVSISMWFVWVRRRLQMRALGCRKSCGCWSQLGLGTSASALACYSLRTGSDLFSQTSCLQALCTPRLKISLLLTVLFSIEFRGLHFVHLPRLFQLDEAGRWVVQCLDRFTRIH